MEIRVMEITNIYKEGEERSSQRKPRRKRSERLGDETGKGDTQKKRE